jgi:hypothetical protein
MCTHLPPYRQGARLLSHSHTVRHLMIQERHWLANMRLCITNHKTAALSCVDIKTSVLPCSPTTFMTTLLLVLSVWASISGALAVQKPTSSSGKILNVQEGYCSASLLQLPLCSSNLGVIVIVMCMSVCITTKPFRSFATLGMPQEQYRPLHTGGYVAGSLRHC